MRNVAGKMCIENPNYCVLNKIFSANRAVYDILVVLKNIYACLVIN